jgi:hypothetical protein
MTFSRIVCRRSSSSVEDVFSNEMTCVAAAPGQYLSCAS